MEEQQFHKLSRNDSERPLLVFKGTFSECGKFRDKQELTLWLGKEKTEEKSRVFITD